MNKAIIILSLLMVLIISGCAMEEEVEVDNGVTGGVIICGIDYPCGQADDLCPEDYGATCKVADVDCEK